jgi:hypothetical protein
MAIRLRMAEDGMPGQQDSKNTGAYQGALRLEEKQGGGRNTGQENGGIAENRAIIWILGQELLENQTNSAAGAIDGKSAISAPSNGKNQDGLRQMGFAWLAGESPSRG